tara:strand:+ start:1006 stop:1146 length:141 start_codon:yes stop_codon:yes gene_type:complete
MAAFIELFYKNNYMCSISKYWFLLALSTSKMGGSNEEVFVLVEKAV